MVALDVTKTNMVTFRFGILSKENMFSIILLIICSSFAPTLGRNHTLKLKNDVRQTITMSTFGFYKNGYLEVHLEGFSYSPLDSPLDDSKVFGFSLEKTVTDATSAYLQNQDKCLLEATQLQDDVTMAVVIFTQDLKNKRLRVNCSHHLQSIRIFPDYETYRSQSLLSWQLRATRDITSDHYLLSSHAVRKPKSVGEQQASPVESSPQDAANSTTNSQTSVTQLPKSLSEDSNSCQTANIPIFKSIVDDIPVYSTRFIVAITRETEEGLYNLNFHNCPNYRYTGEVLTAINLTVTITEKNDDNYLSAGEMPLPALYFTMSVLFFLSGCFWVFILRKSNQEDVFKIHYVMAVLVYLKSFNLMFHGIHYHFIQTYGIHVEGWAILDYVTHLLKGALMFTTIVLISSGWAFIKYVLSDKEKKIFMIVIPLQVLDNVAGIIMEESEEGDTSYLTWKNVFILVDLLCCGAILFPVIWSIRHLQEASQTDGKAAVNLRKLKLFRHFYIMIVCYIYFSRIIVQLLKITVPFQYEWLDEMFYEMAAFVFFVLTGYKFRPASNNPYFQLTQDDSDLEMDQVITQSGLTEGLKKVNQHKDEDENGSSNKRESSLDYD